MKIQELLDQAKEQSEIPSDNQLAQKLCVSQAAVWKWRKGRDLPKPQYANKLAILAGLDPALIVAEVLMEGAKDKDLLETFARFKRSVAAAFPVLLVLPQMVDTVVCCILC